MPTPTPLMLVSLGLGLSTLAAVALIQGNIRNQVLEQLPANAPTFYFIDIQNDQLARFQQILHAQPGVSDIAEVPSLRARVVAVNGVPAEQVRATPETQWALRGDRGLTYSARPPEGTKLVAGEWWPADYAGPPLVSFDVNLARGWGVKLGDTIRVNVLGREIDLKIASLRDIAWRSLSLNFTMVASPGLLARAPHTHLATLRVDATGNEGRLLRTVTDALPNVSGIRVADVLSSVAAILGKLAGALAATGSVTLAAGALVLVGAVAAGQRRRMAEAVVLKTLGATRGQVRAAWLVEFGLIGACAGLIAAVVGTLAAVSRATGCATTGRTAPRRLTTAATQRSATRGNARRGARTTRRAGGTKTPEDGERGASSRSRPKVCRPARSTQRAGDLSSRRRPRRRPRHRPRARSLHGARSHHPPRA